MMYSKIFQKFDHNILKNGNQSKSPFSNSDKARAMLLIDIGCPHSNLSVFLLDLLIPSMEASEHPAGKSVMYIIVILGALLTK